MRFEERPPKPGESFGIWLRSRYELAEDPEHGTVIRPVERPAGVTWYWLEIVPGDPGDGDAPKESPAVDLFNVLMGEGTEKIGETPGERFKHWEQCGTCALCEEIKQRCLKFANRWGLLGLWRLEVLGDHDVITKKGAFGKDPRVVVERQEPVGLFVRAAAVFAEHYRELNQQAGTEDVDYDGGVAEALAGYLIEPGNSVYRTLRDLFAEDPTVLWGWYQHLAALQAPERLGMSAQVYQREVLQKMNQVIASAFVGTLESLETDKYDSETAREIKKSMAYYALLAFKSSPRPDLDRHMSRFISVEPDPQRPGSYVPRLRWGAQPKTLGAGSLNQILREIGMLVLRRRGAPVLVYSFPTLWHAVHLQVALWIAREGRILGFCERCGGAFLREKRARAYVRKYCSEPCKVAASRARRAKLDRKENQG